MLRLCLRCLSEKIGAWICRLGRSQKSAVECSLSMKGMSNGMASPKRRMWQLGCVEKVRIDARRLDN